MAKKNKKGVVILSILLTISLLVGVITPIFLFNPSLNKIIQEDFHELIKSDFVLKIGIIDPLIYVGNFRMRVNEEGTITTINSFIDNFYGYVIFDAPIEFNNEDLTEGLRQINREAEHPETAEYFEEQIFSDKLIDTMEKKELRYNDLILIAEELDRSADVFCQGFYNFISDEKNDMIDNEMNLILELCNKKPSKIFKRQGTKYIVELPDIEIYDSEYTIECGDDIREEDTLPKGTIHYSHSAYHDGVEFTTKYCYKIPTRERIYKGTYKFSNIKLEMYEKAGDIMIALNDKGIEEAKRITPKFQFEQYGFEVEHENSKNFMDWNPSEESGYMLISNSIGIINASEGKISESSTLEDLWQGFKMGELFRSPTYMISLVIIGVSWLLVLIFGISLIFVVRRKK